MSYYYQDLGYADYSYEYVDNSKHGNGNYGYVYDTHPDPYEPYHSTPPEPDVHYNEVSTPWDEGPEYETGEEIYEETEGAEEAHEDEELKQENEGCTYEEMDYKTEGDEYHPKDLVPYELEHGRYTRKPRELEHELEQKPQNP